MMIDLSFTRDPVWIAEREAVWGPIAADLKSDLRKKELELLRHYVFTGEIAEGYHPSDDVRILYFPLTTPEGWNYVFQHLARDGAALYKSEYYRSINDSLVLLGDMDVRLRYFDYFHGEQPAAQVTTPVPVTPKGEPLTFDVNTMKKFQRLCANALSFVENNRYELIYLRRSVFFNMLESVAQEPKLEGSSSHKLLIWLMEHIVNFNPKADIKACEPQKTLLAEFKGAVENLEDNNIIKQYWFDVQKSGLDS